MIMNDVIRSRFGKISTWIIGLSLCIGLAIGVLGSRVALSATPPTTVTFYGSPSSSISSAVAVPQNRAYYWTSGTVPPVVDPNAPPGSTARYGDTKTQAVNTLERIKTLLAEVGLGMENVVYLRCYLVADPALGKVDYQGWFDAYAQYFNNPNNPVKTARSTVGVAGLVDSGWLVEVEAVAIYPKRGSAT
jgi:enamine deaminase RidA (YjgF/YER057c/UK114 family)